MLINFYIHPYTMYIFRDLNVLLVYLAKKTHCWRCVNENVTKLDKLSITAALVMLEVETFPEGYWYILM